MLEEELGTRLFQRTTRRLTPTEAGIVYFERIEPIVEQLEQAQHAVAELNKYPKGRLRITAPVTFGQLTLVSWLPEFAELYSELSFDLLLTDAVLDLLEERIDVALRLGTLSDSGFVATKLCTMDSIVCASPRYIERYGQPQAPSDLENHNCLYFPKAGSNSSWQFQSLKGDISEIPVQGRYIISNALALKDCVIAGMGITLLPHWIVWRELEDERLVNIFPDYEVTATDFDCAAWMFYPSRSYLPLKVRVFVNFVKEKFRQGMPWDG